tara:strand:+ start:5331 stop:6062 length:732 start_codon:yes stop_codon:yes gene_type:complete
MINGIIITARLSSSRLPGKVLLKCGKQTMIEYLISRLNISKFNNKIVVAIDEEKSDDKLEKFLKSKKINYFRGSSNNVTKRVIDAATFFKFENITLITGDCPLIDYQLLDQCIRVFYLNKCDFVTNCNFRSYPDGMDVQIFKLKSLKKIYKGIKNDLEKEHVTLGLRNNLKTIRTINLIAPKKLFWPSLGLTLDEKKDYILIKKIVKHFKNRIDYNCLDILNYLNNNKELIKINSNVKRKGDS